MYLQTGLWSQQKRCCGYKMILKNIKINNIRSYENEEIEFKLGSTLLSGDIGSGKTSILLAIEFALFGLQPGQRGSSLLRNGKNEGEVILEFEIDNKNVKIERNLKRGKTISQESCSITIDGEREDISVTEVKNRVLELMDYPREFAKKQNILYRFTVYTPQEEMKQIILEDPETRINTLRHVFGIDKYKRIIENASILASKLREEKRMKEGQISTLEQDKILLVEKEEEQNIKKYNLVDVERNLVVKQEKRKEIQKEQERISDKIEEKRRLEQEIEKTRLMILTKKDLISTNEKTLTQIASEVNELEKIKFDELQITILEKEIIALKINRQEIASTQLETSSKISSLLLKNKDNENTKRELSKIEICPTCLQDVSPVYKSNAINQLDTNTIGNVKQLEVLNLEKNKIAATLNVVDNETYQKEKQIQELKILRVRYQELKEKQLRIKEVEKNILSLGKDVELLNQHLHLLQTSVFELRKFDNLFKEKQKEFEEASKEERLAEIKVAELKKEIDVFSRQISELMQRIKKTEGIREQLIYLSRLEDWITKNFIPLISFIEKNVMIKLKTEFSKLFSEWFSMLVTDSFNVRLDDNFTPIIEQQDYEIDYAYLSGGERTAVALAYRLSLNQVINSLLSKIKTKDLVILDEPTDGFSEQQLDKMRDVLQQLNVKQLIIVSHEQKIEGFVENVMRFKKYGRVSRQER